MPGLPQHGRILMVDDESNARAALKEILREEGCPTQTAAVDFKALGKLDEFMLDVILTDLKMPGLDGIAFMEKARSAAPGTVFVVMTAFGTISSAVDAMKSNDPKMQAVLALVAQVGPSKASVLVRQPS